MSILVVDDESFIRQMLAEFLADQGYTVHTAGNGQEGLDCYRQLQPKLVITDLAMPVMSGLAMLEAMGPISDLSHSTVVLTGHGTDQTVKDCYALGVQNFLRKPVNLQELAGVVKRCFRIINYAAELEQANREKQVALRNLEEQHELLKLTFDQIMEAAMIIDHQFKVRTISRKGLEMLGLTAESSKGKSARSLLGAEVAGPRGLLSLCAGEAGAIQSQEARVLCQNGQVLPTQISITPIGKKARSGYLLVLRDTRAEERQQRESQGMVRFGRMVGADPAMKKIFALIDKVATSNASVLVRGESGTGKELVARELHDRGYRAQGPFHAVNCAAIAPDLLESEFFGHERGAFTGAHSLKQGRFEMAHHGTLFLDEVGEIPMGLQGKLLRALQERCFERVGGNRTIEVDIRVVAATNRNLEEMIANGRFREDLFYRLNVVPVDLPPLRQRPGDILLLSETFCKQLNTQEGREVHEISPEAAHLLLNYHWPGNIRELYNVLEYAFAVGEGACIGPGELPELFKQQKPKSSPVDERTHIQYALEQTGYNQSRAAALLGVDRSTLYRKRKKYGL